MLQADSLPTKSRSGWPINVATVTALGAALAGIGPVFSNAAWWFVAMGVASLVAATVTTTRSLTRFAIVPSLAGFGVLVACLTFSFSAKDALLGFVPTPQVLGTFRALIASGFTSIELQSIPAEPVVGIVFMVTAGAGLLALILDAIVNLAHRPAFVGVPLLSLVLVPSAFDPTEADPFFFVVTAIAYLFVLYLGIGEPRSGGAVGVGAAGLVSALLLPMVLPPLADRRSDGPGFGGFAVGVSSFVTLGESLRRPNITRVLTYATSSGEGQYLTLSSIDNFAGNSWRPDEPVNRQGATLESIGPIPGLASNIGTLKMRTNVAIVNMGGRWLPVPYAPSSVTGLEGDWSWDPENLTITSLSDSSRGANYSIESELADPTLEQLQDAGTRVPDGLERYLQLPDDLQPIVAATAEEVVDGSDTHFEQALDLQSFFTTGQFSYSEAAPVREGYDGTSTDVVAAFLEQKSGYCVHFSSAMAVMARTLGIPARISVGFTPGSLVKETAESNAFFAVTTADLHAWPELYFDGIGWVRFEPTPGRGELPNFDDTSAGTTPNRPADESAGPTAPRPDSTPTSTPTPTETAAVAGGSLPPDLTIARITLGLVAVAAVVVLLLPLLPVLIRSGRRSRRYWQVWRRQSARDAWAEVSDTATDHGWPVEAATPREFAERVRKGMSAAGLAALERLRSAVEATAYSRTPGSATIADIRTVRRSLGNTATRAQRLRAILTPRSAAVRGSARSAAARTAAERTAAERRSAERWSAQRSEAMPWADESTR